MSDTTVEDAYAFLRDHTTGDLRFDEYVRPLKYVVAPDGTLVAPAMVAMLASPDTVLFVPELGDDAMEVQVTLEEFEERGEEGALADRWRIHHGDPPDVRWAHLVVDAARYHEVVIDGEALMRPNALAPDEPRLCRTMNARPDDLRALCRHLAGVDVETPVMVAIDPDGLHVRATFGVVRLRAPEPMPGAADAERILAAALEAARAAPGGTT